MRAFSNRGCVLMGSAGRRGGDSGRSEWSKPRRWGILIALAQIFESCGLGKPTLLSSFVVVPRGWEELTRHGQSEA